MEPTSAGLHHLSITPGSGWGKSQLNLENSRLAGGEAVGSREEEEEQGQSRRQGSGGHGGCRPPGAVLGSAAADVGMKGGGRLGAK